MVQYKQNYSQRVLVQLTALSLVLAAVVLLNMDFITDIYIKNQVTNTGYIVNSIIIVLFLLGIIKIVGILTRYTLEERSLRKFLKNVDDDSVRPTEGINENSIISKRYASIVEISRHNVAVNHSALASTLVATESTHLSLPKFITNILILTGVFGTIVSLSIALLGASSIIDSAEGIGGMSVVIHGMSTALSTTTTAIVCYLFFGYFYLKAADVQTQMLSAIEQTTSLYILPRFTYQADSMLHEVGNLVRALREAAESMTQTQADYAETGHQIREITANYGDRLSRLHGDIEDIKSLLKNGFRLPE